MKKRLISLLLAVIMVFGLVACSSTSDANQDTTAAGNDTTAADTAEETTAEETDATGTEAKIFYTNQAPTEYFEFPWWNAGTQVYNKVLFETLIGLDANNEPTTDSGMAESYELSDDGLTLVVTLREGLKWHDGEDVTADDVLWSMETVTNELLTVNSVIKSVMTNIEEATAEGNVITIKFATVNPNALLACTLFHVLPKHCLENADMSQFQQDSFWQSPIGSGPFKLDSSVMGEYASFVPFEAYWGGVADFSIYSSASSMDADANLVTNAKAGLIDYAYTKAYADVQALEGVEGINIHPVSVLYTRFLRFNQFQKTEGEVNPLSDVRVRQAIAYAIDRATICAQVFGGAADPGDGTPTPTGNSWKVEGLEPYAYDLTKAQELLNEAGWDSSITLELGYYYTDQQTVDLMAIIQQMLAQVGVNVEPKLYEGDLATIMNGMPTSRDLETGVSTVNWDILYAALGATSNHDYYTSYHGVTGIRNYAPMNDEVTAYIDEMMGTTDVDAQKAAYAKLEQFWNENMWEIPLYYQPIWIVTSDKIDSNVDTWGNPQFAWDWDLQNWTLS